MSTHLPTDLANEISSEVQRVALAMALLWTYRPRTAIYSLLGLLHLRRDDGRAFTQDDVKRCIGALRQLGWIDNAPGCEGYMQLHEAVRGRLYRHALGQLPVDAVRSALHQLDRFGLQALPYRWPLYDPAATIALLRLELMAGASLPQLDELRQLIQRSHDWDAIFYSAALSGFDAACFERVNAEVRWTLAYSALLGVSGGWRAELMPFCEWADQQFEREPSQAPEHVRLALAEFFLHRAEHARARSCLQGQDSGAADALRACLLVHKSRWSEAQLAFEAAFKRRKSEIGARKRILPASVSWLYPLTLLAQQTPQHLELARKFCLGEAGGRAPSPTSGWGRWVHAISVRLGDTALDPAAFALTAVDAGSASIDDLWQLLLAAWLGRDRIEADTRNLINSINEDAVTRTTAAINERLQACGFGWLTAQADAAAAVLHGRAPAPGFFVAARSEQWRDVLAALQALGSEGAVRDTDAPSSGVSRIVWTLALAKDGRLDAIAPLTQTRGLRGWSKPKPLGLAKIVRNEKLPPWDAKVARAIRQQRAGARHCELDRAAALAALVGHPAVALAAAPEQLIELVEATPELEVIKDGERFVLRITPPLRADDSADERYYFSADQRREAEALRMMTLAQDSPQRWRLIRFSAAQRRAAQLLSKRFSVPAHAHAELQQTLRALVGHFDVHADQADAAREVEAESRLRAELSPVGEQLMLRLVVAPLGADGPRLVPGRGRERVMASVRGEAVGSRRDLAAERGHLEQVLDVLAFLLAPDASAGYEWMIADPENALEAVEALPKLAAVSAVDWPKGKAVRVVTLDVAHLAVKIDAERDWFRLSGHARIDEQRVMQFATLLAAAQTSSRFVPIGDGTYAALTHSLKRRLNELATVGETQRDEVRVSRLAAAWLDELLESVPLEADAGFRSCLERLRQAYDQTLVVPRTLQAELRPYQEEGYRWAMRLAHAGFGACLADDMGLGKTLQGLAVLLARGAEGPALVIAPTSVCGNWIAEAQRFAPALNLLDYGEGERAAALANAGPMDVIVVSYTLLLQAAERFAARKWHTVIADEAQAIKNAAAKRSLAVFELNADFRMALSGTPVENRLAELWSIMRFVNPGLLGSLARFNQRFATPIERDRSREAQQVLKKLIAPFVLRRTKAQVLQDLPPRTELVLPVAPEPAEAAHYEALRRQAAAAADHALSSAPLAQARINILAQLMRLRRAACDPRLVSEAPDLRGAKLQVFLDLVSSLVANGHKALVFSQFVDYLSLLRAALDAAKVAYQYLDGATPGAVRTQRVAAFQAGAGDVFLISLKAGGFGLNLTAADYVVITDPWWNPAAEDQASGRAHRIGQQRPVTVYRLVTQGTVEESIVALHHDKRALAESILGDSGVSVLPSTEDLMALIRGESTRVGQSEPTVGCAG